MSSTRTLRQRRSQETRELILDAAYRVFANRGYGQSSVDAVIAEAGLSKGAFYHHFTSKDELFKALIQDRQRKCIDQMTDAVIPASSRRDAIERLVGVGLQSNEADPDWVRIYFEFCMQAMREEFARNIVSASLRECRGIVAQMLKRGQESGSVRADLDLAAAALLLIGLFDGIALHTTIDQDAAHAPAIAGTTADLIDKFIQ
jgi:AcrR family transcriptional regulator